MLTPRAGRYLDGTLDMFASGLLAIAQICFLPGALIASVFRLSPYQRSVLAFPFSLLANYVLVYGLTLAGLYRRETVLAIIAAEMVALGYATWKRAREPGSSRSELAPAPPPSQIEKTFIVLALFASSWLVLRLLRMTPSPFHRYDDICNWNRWAIDWSRGLLPFRTWEYPQLLPTNWSLTYVLTGSTEIEYFATAVNGLIACYVLWPFWALYLETRDRVFLFALPICATLLGFTLGWFLGQGMADIPSAFFGGALLYASLLAFRGMVPARDYFVLGALITSGAIVTKQSGNFLVIYYIATAWLVSSRFGIARGEFFKRLGAGIALITVIAWSWYAYHRWRYVHGREYSNITYTAELIYEGKSHFDRFLTANAEIIGRIRLLDRFWPPAAIFGVAMAATVGLTALSLSSPAGFAAAVFCWVPFYFIWAVFYSYGHNQRNFGLGITFVAFTVALGLDRAQRGWADRFSPATRRKACVGIACLLAACAVIRANRLWDGDAILRHRIEEYTVHSTMYDALYKLRKEGRLDGKVLTNYGCDRCNVFPGMDAAIVTEIFAEWKEYEALIRTGAFRYLLIYTGRYTAPFFVTGPKASVASGLLEPMPEGGDDRDGQGFLGQYQLYRVKPEAKPADGSTLSPGDADRAR